jgi:hypothetical protein
MPLSRTAIVQGLQQILAPSARASDALRSLPRSAIGVQLDARKHDLIHVHGEVASAKAFMELRGKSKVTKVYQGKAKFPLCRGRLLSLRRQRRKPPIGRIGNSRRARPGALHAKERRAIIAVIDVALGRAPVEYPRSRLVQLSALRLGEKFLVRIFGRAL